MGAACSRSGDRPIKWAGHVSVPVTLHIYNLGKSSSAHVVNNLLRQLGTGAFHCGVEVFGVEWSFSDIATAPGELARGTGIFCCEPRKCEGHSFSESIPMGKTGLSETDLLKLIHSLKHQWPVYSYHTLRRNCCHFSDEFCRRLGVGGIPTWVMNLANAGAALVDVGDNVCCRSNGQGLWCCSSEIQLNGGRRQSLAARRSGAAAAGVADETEELGNDSEVVDALPVLPPMRRHSEDHSNDMVLVQKYRSDYASAPGSGQGSDVAEEWVSLERARHRQALRDGSRR
mmetsp:Transcript_23668/g.51763  ORF Transcript_23668/g.51763 Transcript_23668/m.51763 type:complete len:286 (+) Transcript_23668:300-1157(+)